MKSLKAYLIENKKLYKFIIKIAGTLNDSSDFINDLKTNLEKYKVVNFEKVASTPIQKHPIDFPDQINSEVNIFHVTLEYPTIPAEIISIIHQLGVDESAIKVHNENDPGLEQDTLEYMRNRSDNKKSSALLNDEKYSETSKINHKEYYGNDHISGFLKDLQGIAKKRKSDDPEISEYKLPKNKSDKLGVKSAIGGKNGFSQIS